MKQIFKQHACSKRAVYSDPGICSSNFSLSMIGSCPSRAMSSSHLRQAIIRTQIKSVSFIHEAQCFGTSGIARLRPSSPFSNDSFNTPFKKLPGVFRSSRGPGYEVVVLKKLIT
ncbi:MULTISPECIES: hypothetical protein [Pseudomonas]|jgi:hypothetical protein|uniref:hypothetical protein n=1 Tax=Pseudomonas TaxID=286 RepID=UPI000F96C8A8|nr:MULTISPECIES: hypothetical protein [Pseudomonas]MDD1996724.1 hypothetical protein [Pseudomonas putida]MDN4511035.1 hypothetical protein [Pseudomonas sp. 2,4-D]MDW2775826.1 hypothetical protein [Pseudomonas sp. BEA3.1]TFW39352.1 hypothetical protein E4195_03770 [Pseudomonas putida]HDS1787366.1 hypothetical protein [Pseudomonas putida]